MRRYLVLTEMMDSCPSLKVPIQANKQKEKKQRNSIADFRRHLALPYLVSL